MNVKRKTIRFQDTSADLSAYEAISDYKSYGFRSENHMVIEAIKRLIAPKAGDLSADELATAIAKKLSGNISVSSLQTENTIEEPRSKEAAFDAALDFLDNL